MRRLERRHGSLFVTWFEYVGRSATLAKELGAEAVFVSAGRSGNVTTALVRYILQSVQTLRILSRKRPKTIIVMAPPLPLVALAWVVSKPLRSHLIIDAHTGVFNDPKWAWTLGVFMWFARRSTATIVTNRQLVDRLERADVKAISLHDPPIPSASKSSKDVAFDQSSKESVIVPSSFSSDEPIDAIVDAAKELPSVTFYITGPLPRRFSPSLIKAPTNVVFTGFLPHTEYQDLLRSAGIVLALTTRELTMQRAGYEALSSHKPLLTSDTQVLREYFTEGAVFTLPYADDIRAGVLRCLENLDSLAKGMASLHRQKLAEWDSELSHAKRYLEHLP